MFKCDQTGALFRTLTSAEATCLAMMNIRLSVISQGGFTLSLKKVIQKVLFASFTCDLPVCVFEPSRPGRILPLCIATES